MSKSGRTPDAPGRGDSGVSLDELGLHAHTVSRRSMLKAGLGVAAGAGVAAVAGTAAAPPAWAGLNKVTASNARRIAQLTGPLQTSQWGAPYTDLGIPVQIPGTSTLLFIGGDTYGAGNPESNDDWRAPVGLTGPVVNLATDAVRITGAIADPGQTKAKGLVPEGHVSTPNGPTTALPSDVFYNNRTGVMYMHLMRGHIYDTDHTDFWRSDNHGQTWTYLRRFEAGTYGGFYQQKTYAADTNDDYVYVLTTAFRRQTFSDMYLFRVLKADLDANDDVAGRSGFGDKFAYQGWGYANGRWAWGNQPTSVTERRQWGEICFRAMDGQYALSWFQYNEAENFRYADIRAMVFPYPTSNLVQTTEQTMVYNSAANPASGNGQNLTSVQPALYGGFIIPGSTFDNFNFLVSNWIRNGVYAPQDNANYVISHWKTALKRGI